MTSATSPRSSTSDSAFTTDHVTEIGDEDATELTAEGNDSFNIDESVCHSDGGCGKDAKTATKAEIVHNDKVKVSQGASLSSDVTTSRQENSGLTPEKSSASTMSTSSKDKDSDSTKIEASLDPSWDQFSDTNADFSSSVTVSQTLTANSKTIQIPSSSSSDAGHFLAFEAPSSVAGPATVNQGEKDESSGPFADEPRSVDSNRVVSPGQAVEEPGVVKAPRRADAGPDMNDLFKGLLNVVGEGLSIATNYVKEEQSKKQQLQQQQQAVKPGAGSSLKIKDNKKADADDLLLKLQQQEYLLQQQQQLLQTPPLRPSRINNRGPPRFTEIPFEAIPLEVLSGPPVPGQRPQLQIPQRPFR